MYSSKFFELIRRNMHVWFNVFTSIFPCLTGSSQHVYPRSSQCWLSMMVFDTVLRPAATRGVRWGVFKEKMVMHMVVVTLALRVFKKKLIFFTFYQKVFNKLLSTQNYLFVYF
ncbi:hypothetical protein HanIR_Chr16g0843461 [Helianthus annuus]|nr:hypothetical protein HanIR_Chr16g0843461 [Helianthus annuus]